MGVAGRKEGIVQLALIPPKILSYGGGLDSWAMLLERVEAGEKPDAVVFCDVGDPKGKDPAEWPGTYKHMREVVLPFCRRHRIPFHWLDTKRYPVRDARSLFAWMWARGQIPVSGPKRLCTIIAKVERFERWLDDHYPDQVVEVWIGFEAGEEGRAAKDPNAGTGRRPEPGQALRKNRFPLIERGICRCRAAALCRRLRQPIPLKSACVFCPYGSKGDWQQFAAEVPTWFDQVESLEAKKPPTKRGFKLSIMGYRAKKDPVTREVLSYKAPPVRQFIQGTYRPKLELCEVCGAPVKLQKAVGCSYEAAA